jgi:uncharacterized protein YoxC
LIATTHIDTLTTILTIAGIVVACTATVLAILHLRALSHVRKVIDDAQHQIAVNRDATETLRQQTLDALGLHEIIVTDDDLSMAVKEISIAFANVRGNDDVVLTRMARHELGRTTSLLRSAAEGHLDYDEDSFADAEWLASSLLSFTGEGDEFWATSLVDADFWRHAGAYLQQQREKVKAGVIIKRVFVFDNEIDDESRSQMDLQADAGIEVEHVTSPKTAARDLVVVLRPSAAGEATPIYAGDFRVRDDKRIDRMDLWVASDELQAEKVHSTWWALQQLVDEARPLRPPTMPALE